MRISTGIGLLCISAVLGGNLTAASLVHPDSLHHNRIYLRPVEYEQPSWGIEVHKINKLHLAVSNGGTFGIGFDGTEIDPETGGPAPSCEYPANSNVTYLYYGAFWAGAVVGSDTLVSVGFDGNYAVEEFWPPSGDEGYIQRRSTMPTSTDYHPDAVSEQDFICTYTDTFTDENLTGVDPIDSRAHKPLYLEVEQRSYGWSYDYTEDFVIFDFVIRSINQFPIQDVYFGIYIDADVYHISEVGYVDDICGYVSSMPSRTIPGFEDTLRIAWTADNNGDPDPEANNQYSFKSATSVTGTQVLRSPNPDIQFNFNWWVWSPTPSLDWGPRRVGTEERPYRDFGTGMGSPNGDISKYYVMSGGGFDYDQMETAISHTRDGFLPPPEIAGDIADGFDARYLFSFGPFNIQPGDSLPITLAYVAGEDFHQDPTAFTRLWDPLNPRLYINSLSFDSLGVNALWAKWVYDNPGVDTDGDGNFGKFFWKFEDGDTVAFIPEDELSPDSLDERYSKVFYEGDGVPDFRGAAPPPSPVLRVLPERNRLKLRWNGELSENDIDPFSGKRDFEGYRVYMGADNRLTDYVLLASYDRDDYNLFTWDSFLRQWNLSDIPLRSDSIATLFGPDFDPMQHLSPDNPYSHAGGLYYFQPQDWNESDLTDPYGIRRVYPNADPKNKTDTTAEGYLRYYEYEYIIDGLQSSVPYWVAVTAFDYGSRTVELSALESAIANNEIQAYPLSSSETVEEQGLEVSVYPNPYRIDAGYALSGYENRDRTLSADRARLINFINLPPKCTIRIFSIDGDLVKEIRHDKPSDDPSSQHATWDLISRNTQAVVTGIYIYQVSSEMGDQLGKIVIIK